MCMCVCENTLKTKCYVREKGSSSTDADAHAVRLIRSPCVSQSNIITSITAKAISELVRSKSCQRTVVSKRKKTDLHARMHALTYDCTGL